VCVCLEIQRMPEITKSSTVSRHLLLFSTSLTFNRTSLLPRHVRCHAYGHVSLIFHLSSLPPLLYYTLNRSNSKNHIITQEHEAHTIQTSFLLTSILLVFSPPSDLPILPPAYSQESANGIRTQTLADAIPRTKSHSHVQNFRESFHVSQWPLLTNGSTQLPDPSS
jgi:hypothetical protein